MHYVEYITIYYYYMTIIIIRTIILLCAIKFGDEIIA